MAAPMRRPGRIIRMSMATMVVASALAFLRDRYHGGCGRHANMKHGGIGSA